MTLPIPKTEIERLLAITLLRAEQAEARLDEERAAIAALREAARVALLYGSDAGLTTREGQPIAEGSGPFAVLRGALAATPATPATLAGQARARALREAADVCDAYGREGDQLSKEYACESADELAARIRALPTEAPEPWCECGDGINPDEQCERDHKGKWHCVRCILARPDARR